MTSFQTLNSCPQLHTETSMHTYQLEVNSRKHWAHTQSVTAAQNAWERRQSWQITTPDTHQWNYSSNQRVLPHKLNLAKATQNWVLSEDLGGGGVTSKDSVVTVATTGQTLTSYFGWFDSPLPGPFYGTKKCLPNSSSFDEYLLTVLSGVGSWKRSCLHSWQSSTLPVHQLCSRCRETKQRHKHWQITSAISTLFIAHLPRLVLNLSLTAKLSVCLSSLVRIDSSRIQDLPEMFTDFSLLGVRPDSNFPRYKRITSYN